jgi:hypothetical protein
MEILIRRNNRYLIVIIRNLHIFLKKYLEKKNILCDGFTEAMDVGSPELKDRPKKKLPKF